MLDIGERLSDIICGAIDIFSTCFHDATTLQRSNVQVILKQKTTFNAKCKKGLEFVADTLSFILILLLLNNYYIGTSL